MYILIRPESSLVLAIAAIELFLDPITVVQVPCRSPEYRADAFALIAIVMREESSSVINCRLVHCRDATWSCREGVLVILIRDHCRVSIDTLHWSAKDVATSLHQIPGLA